MHGLDRALPGAVTGGKYEFGELTLEIEPGHIVAACRFLKTTGNSMALRGDGRGSLPGEPRFEMIYHFHSIARNARLRLKCRVAGVIPPSIRSPGVPGARKLVRARGFRSVRRWIPQSSGPAAHHASRTIGKGIRCAKIIR